MRFRFRAEQQTGYRMREITSPGIYQVLLSQNHRPPPTAHPVRAPKVEAREHLPLITGDCLISGLQPSSSFANTQLLSPQIVTLYLPTCVATCWH